MAAGSADARVPKLYRGPEFGPRSTGIECPAVFLMKIFGPVRRLRPDGFIPTTVALLAAVLLLAAPSLALTHEHPEDSGRPDQSHSHCRACEVSTTEAMVLEAGPELPVAFCDARPSRDETGIPAVEPAATSGIPRAPPA